MWSGSVVLALMIVPVFISSPNTKWGKQDSYNPPVSVPAPVSEAEKLNPMSLQIGRYEQVGSVTNEWFQEKLRISVPYVDIKDDSLIVHLKLKNESSIPVKYLIGNGIRDPSQVKEIEGLPEIEDQYGNKYTVQLPTMRGEIAKYSFEAEPFAWGGKLTDKYLIPVGVICGAYMVFPKPKDTNNAKLYIPGVNGWIFANTIDIQLTNRHPLTDVTPSLVDEWTKDIDKLEKEIKAESEVARKQNIPKAIKVKKVKKRQPDQDIDMTGL